MENGSYIKILKISKSSFYSPKAYLNSGEFAQIINNNLQLASYPIIYLTLLLTGPNKGQYFYIYNKEDIEPVSPEMAILLALATSANEY